MQRICANLATVLALVVVGGCARQGAGESTPPEGTGGGGGAGGEALFPSGSGSTGSGGEKVIDDPEGPCDFGIAVGEEDPLRAAASIGMCKRAGDKTWGLMSAEWVLTDGKPVDGQPDYHLGHGVLENFGPDVRPLVGDRMLALSSGTARVPGDADWASPSGYNKGYSSGSPTGFPKESEACPGVLTGRPFDGVALQVRLRAPETANSYGFRFNFYTYEWPDYICSTFNDFFVALVDPKPEGQADGNISFDALGNPVSVNNAFLSVCGCAAGPPCFAPPDEPKKLFLCEQGTTPLTETGFETRAATGWLSTKAPVKKGGEITLRFSIYDSGDGSFDSLVLIDDFRWLGDIADNPETKPDVPK